MSRAISAKNAAERATILAGIIRRNPDGRYEGRELSNCLEMGDGEEVMRLIRQRIATGKLEYATARKYLTAESLHVDTTGAHATYAGRLYDVIASQPDTLTLRTFDRSSTITAPLAACTILERTYTATEA